jgi:succinate dehydrogenase / fumarate reductase flavoprotein subunit
MTNIQGLYAFGEVNFAYHGANRLGANALLSCIFDGLFCGLSVVNYIKGDVAKQPAADLPQASFDNAVGVQSAKSKKLMDTASTAGDTSTNPYVIGKELGDEMTAACTVVRSEPRLNQCLKKIDELRERYSRVTLSDAAGWTNQSFGYARAVGDMIALAEALAKGALERRESRGAHYRSDYTERDDANFMKTTVARCDANLRTSIEFVPIDASLIAPTARTYGKKESSAAKPALAHV